jgi:Tetratricopeptide repeat
MLHKTIWSLMVGILLLSATTSTTAQQLKTDSLLKVLSPKQDLTRVSQLLDIATTYLKTYQTDSTQIKKYANEALTLAQKLHYERGEIKAYSIMCESLFKYLDWKNCSIKADFALERCKTMNNVDDLKGSLLSLKGAIDLVQGNFPTATKHLTQAMQIIEKGMSQYKGGDYDFLNPLYNTNKRLGYVMSMMANDKGLNVIYTQKALAYYRKNLLLCQQHKELTNRLPESYHNLGAIFGFLNTHTDSVDYYIDKEIALAIQLGQTDGQIQGYTMKAQEYFKYKQYKKAEEMMLKVKPLAEKINQVDVVLNVPLMLGEIYTELGRYDEAKTLLETGYRITIEKNLRDKRQRILNGMVNMYERKGDYKKALYYLDQQIVLKDSLYDEAKTREISELSTKYETEKKEQQIKALETDKILRNFLIIALIAVVIGSSIAIWIRYKAIRLEKELMQQKAIVQQEQAEKLKLAMEHNQRELSSAALYLDQRNEFLDKLKTQIKEGENSQKLLNEIDRNMNVEDDWLKFKVHFEQVNPHFFEKSYHLEPNLTDLDLKQCAYIKLNLSPKQAANLLNVTAHAVSTSRTRIKKKLNIPEEMNLSDFLAQV